MAFFPGSDSMTIVTDEDESDEVSLASLHDMMIGFCALSVICWRYCCASI